MKCSKIGFDLFPVGDGAIPRYLDSIEKKLQLPIILLYFWIDIVLFMYILLKSPIYDYFMKCNRYLLLSSDAALAILFIILDIVLKYNDIIVDNTNYNIQF